MKDECKSSVKRINSVSFFIGDFFSVLHTLGSILREPPAGSPLVCRRRTHVRTIRSLVHTKRIEA